MTQSQTSDFISSAAVPLRTWPDFSQICLPLQIPCPLPPALSALEDSGLGGTSSTSNGCSEPVTLCLRLMSEQTARCHLHGFHEALLTRKATQSPSALPVAQGAARP